METPDHHFAGKRILRNFDKSKARGALNESNLNWYCDEIGKIPLLSRTEENKLARRSIAGDMKARETLISSNLRFVVKVAKQYTGYAINLLDIISEGNMGLIHAASKFDPDLGYHFITYAVWWIKQYIFTAINQGEEVIRIPMSRIAYLKKIHKTESELRSQLEREPTLDEVATSLKSSVDKLNRFKSSSHEYVSIDKNTENSPFSSEVEVRNSSDEQPENIAMDSAFHQALNKMIGDLEPNEREIILHRFALNGRSKLSLAALGKKYGITKERVRQIQEKALLKLRLSGQQEHLEAFL